VIRPKSVTLVTARQSRGINPKGAGLVGKGIVPVLQAARGPRMAGPAKFPSRAPVTER
jgi:hypothetical protein